MNILITGCKGQLGTEMRNLSAGHKQHRYFFTDVVGTDTNAANLIRLDDKNKSRKYAQYVPIWS